jgi:dolichyl-phosphate-mannose-protein mannosyltransferase
MGIGFQKTLTGNRYATDTTTPSNIFQKFIELNTEMYKANQRLTATHPYSSQWYTWPFMTRSIYYWVNENSRIYLLGNPIIWWLSTMAVLISILYYVLRIKDKDYFDKTYIFLLAGFALNLLPFIGVNRVMFLYHYFTAYIFATMILVWLISKQKSHKYIFGAIIAVSVIAFIFFAPLSYGLDLPSEAFKTRMWISGWE